MRKPSPPLIGEPILIPLSARYAAQLEAITGFSASTLVELNATEAPGIVRQRGEGNGTRLYLHVESFRRWAATLPVHSG